MDGGPVNLSCNSESIFSDGNMKYTRSRLLGRYINHEFRVEKDTPTEMSSSKCQK